MIINKQILISYKSEIVKYKRGACIFSEGTIPKYYFQILEGTVKICSLNQDGRAFVHGFPFDGHCFGEIYMFSDKDYAVSAFAESTCTIIKIPKRKLFDIFLHHPDELLKVVKYSADRMHFRYIISSFLAIVDPVIKLEILFSYLKSYFQGENGSLYIIPYTRKQIADLTGLRLETVVRVIKRMESLGKLQIIDKQIYY